MSTRTFIGSDQKPAHPLLYCNGQCVQQLRGVLAYLTRVKTAYRVMHLYSKEIYACDEHNAMILVSWIETFIFIRGVIIQ